MHSFLVSNRRQLIARCQHKVSQRPRRSASQAQLANGVPMFLDQLTKTLALKGPNAASDSLRISGGADGTSVARSEMGVSAHAHGQQLLSLGYTVGQVVYDYGDLCQAITELGFETSTPFTVEHFQTLNRCLDNAIAEAVTAFEAQRDAQLAVQHTADTRQQVGFLVHELRNALNTASLAADVLDVGDLTMRGATGAVLRRSLAQMNTLVRRSLDDVRGPQQASRSTFSLDALIADVQSASELEAAAKGQSLAVAPVDAVLRVHGNRELLQAALSNLLQNAFKFSPPGAQVSLRAKVAQRRALIDIADQCGGLPPGGVEKMFAPFHQRSGDKSGLGLGLSIARKAIEADGGSLSVADVPGHGCVFTISLPLDMEG
ncbi:MAG: histidine kinase [Spirosoma sp.]|nr:histidine kinase [Spirosoma sp.]